MSAIENRTKANAAAEAEERFALAVAAALKRRVGTGTALPYKVFAGYMRVSEETVWSWCSGNKSPRGGKLTGLIAFFGPDFVSEIMHGCGLNVGAYDMRDAAASNYVSGIRGAAAAVRAIAALAPLVSEGPLE